MTEPRTKSETLSETTKTHLMDVFVSAKYGRKEEHSGKMLDKGNEREQDSITLLSRITKTFFKKNETCLSNSRIKGTPDLFLGESVENATEIFDTKTSWSAHTFFRAQKELNKLYYWQGVSYMALTGASKCTIAYCLVNGTQQAINDEKRKLAYQMGVIDQSASNPAYKEKCKQIEINHIFDIKSFAEENPFFDFDNEIVNNSWAFDIPMQERLFTISFERNDEDIQRLYNRIDECRKWMNENLFKVNEEEEIIHTSEDTGESQKDYIIRIEEGKSLKKAAGF